MEKGTETKKRIKILRDREVRKVKGRLRWALTNLGVDKTWALNEGLFQTAPAYLGMRGHLITSRLQSPSSGRPGKPCAVLHPDLSWQTIMVTSGGGASATENRRVELRGAPGPRYAASWVRGPRLYTFRVHHATAPVYVAASTPIRDLCPCP